MVCALEERRNFIFHVKALHARSTIYYMLVRVVDWIKAVALIQVNVYNTSNVKYYEP